MTRTKTAVSVYDDGVSVRITEGSGDSFSWVVVGFDDVSITLFDSAWDKLLDKISEFQLRREAKDEDNDS